MKSPIFSIRALLLSSLLLAVSLAAEDLQSSFIYQPDVKVPMRDGVQLATNIFLPKGDGPWPVILVRTPYGKQDEKWSGAKDYAKAGYVTVVQDCRGREKSPGVWEPFLYEARDGYDTQEWVGKQPWCNGDIGTAGASYVGWTQWAAAPNSSKYLKAMAPMVPFANTYDDLAYPSNVMQLGLLMGWGEAAGAIPLAPDKFQQAYSYLPLRTYGDQFEKKVSYLNEWAQHPAYDDYWKQRGIDHRYDDVTVPALNIGGWYDIFAKNTIELTTSVRAKSRSEQARNGQFVIMGPWTHGVGARKVGELDFGAEAELKVSDLQFQWFEHWLKGRKNAVQDWSPYYLFVMGENKWRHENEWPLQRTQFTPYHLHSSGRANSLKGDGTLDVDQPGEEKPDEFTYDGNNPVPTSGGNNIVGAPAGPCDQAKVEEREDVLVYSTSPLEKDLEVTGPVKLVLWAASSARDTDFTGKLVDVHPDGKAYNLCDGIIRARYRNGADKPALLEPGQPQRFEIDLWVTSNLFKRGHRIRLEVSSSNFPRFDRNPNSGNPIGSDDKMLPAKQTILHDRKHPSHLLLPVIPRS